MTETCGPHTYDRMDVDLPERLRGIVRHAVPGVEHKVVDRPPARRSDRRARRDLRARLQPDARPAQAGTRDVFDRDATTTPRRGLFDATACCLLGALGEMIATGRANVTPREVEVVSDLPGSRLRVRGGLPDPVRGRTVAAAVVLKRGATLDAGYPRASGCASSSRATRSRALAV